MTISTATVTTAPTGWATLDLRYAQHAAHGVATWGTKRAALVTLAVLRRCGLNRGRDIEVQRAETHLRRFWVIGRPDHFHGITYLMTAAGAWVPGRLTDAPCFCTPACGGDPVPWTRLAADATPAIVTHDYAFSAGSEEVSDLSRNGAIGWDGRPLPPRLGWFAHAWCIACTWSRHDSHEDLVRNGARHHRAHPDQYPGYLTPRRRPAI